MVRETYLNENAITEIIHETCPNECKITEIVVIRYKKQVFSYDVWQSDRHFFHQLKGIDCNFWDTSYGNFILYR